MRCSLAQDPPVLKLEMVQEDMAMLLKLAGMGKPQACLGDSPTELLLWKNRLKAGHCLGAQGHGQPRDMTYLSGTVCFLLRSSKSGHPKGTRLIPGRAITWPKRVPGTCVFHKNENRNQMATTTVPHNCTSDTVPRTLKTFKGSSKVFVYFKMSRVSGRDNNEF